MSVDKVCNCIKLCIFLSIYVDVDIQGHQENRLFSRQLREPLNGAKS